MFDEIVAIKEYDRSLHPWDKIRAQSEASVMAKLNHPGIVLLVGVSSDPDSDPFLIVELMSGDLRTLIHTRSRGGGDRVSSFSFHVCVNIIPQS